MLIQFFSAILFLTIVIIGIKKFVNWQAVKEFKAAGKKAINKSIRFL